MENHSQEEHAKWHQLVEEQQAASYRRKNFASNENWYYHSLFITVAN
jgi:hypothetical protein